VDRSTGSRWTARPLPGGPLDRLQVDRSAAPWCPSRRSRGFPTATPVWPCPLPGPGRSVPGPRALYHAPAAVAPGLAVPGSRCLVRGSRCLVRGPSRLVRGSRIGGRAGRSGGRGPKNRPGRRLRGLRPGFARSVTGQTLLGPPLAKGRFHVKSSMKQAPFVQLPNMPHNLRMPKTKRPHDS